MAETVDDFQENKENARDFLIRISRKLDLSHIVLGLQILGLKINPLLHRKPMYFCQN